MISFTILNKRKWKSFGNKKIHSYLCIRNLNKKEIMKSTQSKPNRIFKTQKFGLKTIRPFWIEVKSDENLWFSFEDNQWLPYEKRGKEGCTSSYYAMRHKVGLHDVYSLKAVRRLISKWNLPKGTKITASLPIMGHIFTFTKK